jgi:hypothetical protein
VVLVLWRVEWISAMRAFSGYLAIGGLGALAMSVVTIAGLSLAVGARPVIEGSIVVQHVDRTRKTDRLDIRKISGDRPTLKRNFGVMPVGCEPAFSPLSLPTHANFSGRCAA